MRTKRGHTPLILAVGLAGCLAACATPAPAPVTPPPVVVPTPPTRPPEQPAFQQVGLASWYGSAHQGKLTASGEPFDLLAMTAAHRSLAFGTIVRVTNLENGRATKVRINDRGPHVAGRIIDLSARAARELDIEGEGVVRVRIEWFDSDQKRR